jgi:hypothetical protein
MVRAALYGLHGLAETGNLTLEGRNFLELFPRVVQFSSRRI